MRRPRIEGLFLNEVPNLTRNPRSLARQTYDYCTILFCLSNVTRFLFLQDVAAPSRGRVSNPQASQGPVPPQPQPARPPRQPNNSQPDDLDDDDVPLSTYESAVSRRGFP
jgi:hypothetical protein